MYEYTLIQSAYNFMCIITLGNNILPFSSWRGAIYLARVTCPGTVLRSIVGTPRRRRRRIGCGKYRCSLLCGRGSRLITLLVLIYVCVNLHCYDGVDQ